MDVIASYSKEEGVALPQDDISYDRFPVIAIAIQEIDDVQREELRTEPEEVATALPGADPKTRRNVLWGMRHDPCGLDCGADRVDAPAAALGAQEPRARRLRREH